MPFGFNFGGSSSKSSGSFTGTDNTNQNTVFNQNTNYNQTSTPTNPTQVTDGVLGAVGNAATLGAANPQSYVAGQNGLQTQANTTAAGLDGQPSIFGGAKDETAYVMNSAAARTGAATAAPYISQYYNPFQQQVVDATTADLNANDAQTRAAQQLALAKSGAFGGSGSALTIGQTEGQLERARATTLGQLRTTGFEDALSAANNDANRRQDANDLNANLYAGQQDRALTAANQLAGIATAQDANTRANIGTQATQGAALQQTQQQQAQAPLDLQAWLAQNYATLPLGLFQGQTQAGSQAENGVENQQGTETQSGTTKGKTSGMNFGFKAGN